MKRLNLLAGLFCLLLTACQQKIEFTPVAEPTLPNFEVQHQLPSVKPDWDLLKNNEHIISKLEVTSSNEQKSPIKVYQIKGHQGDGWQLKLVGISPVHPVDNADVLVSAFRRQALSMFKKRQTECLESLDVTSSYHSVSIAMKCFHLTNKDAETLGQFWNKGFAKAIDVNTIRRNLKLNRKIQSVTGSDINLVFQRHLLGQKHPYLVMQDRTFFEDLTKQKLRQLQAKTAAQLEWYLFIKAPHKLTQVELTEIAKSISAQMNVQTVSNREVNLNHIKPIKQSRTIYFIDAPDSSDIKVRIGMRFPQYYQQGKPVLESDADWLNQQMSQFACDTLSAILGRRSYGRLFYDLRETRGLTYGAYAYCRNQILLRAMVLWGSASQEHSGAFLEGMLRHLELLRQQTPQTEEVEALKLYFLGQVLINDDQDNGMGVLQLLEPDIESAKLQRLFWLRDTTPQEIQSLANQYLTDAPLVVVRGNANVIVKDLKQKLPDWDIKLVKPKKLS